MYVKEKVTRSDIPYVINEMLLNKKKWLICPVSIFPSVQMKSRGRDEDEEEDEEEEGEQEEGEDDGDSANGDDS